MERINKEIIKLVLENQVLITIFNHMLLHIYGKEFCNTKIICQSFANKKLVGK